MICQDVHVHYLSMRGPIATMRVHEGNAVCAGKRTYVSKTLRLCYRNKRSGVSEVSPTPCIVTPCIVELHVTQSGIYRRSTQ